MQGYEEHTFLWLFEPSGLSKQMVGPQAPAASPPCHSLAWSHLLQAANELRHPPRMEQQRRQADPILQHDDQRGGTHPLWKGGVRGSFRGERQGDPG